MSKTISINQALEFHKEYFIPQIISQHINNVTKVASFLSQKFLEKNLIDKKTQIRIIIATLLHDLTKLTEVKDFEERFVKEYGEHSEEVKFWRNLKEKYSEVRHEDSVCEELKDYPHITQIIKGHGYFANETLDNVQGIEQEILFYSDQRDEYGKIVNIGKRLILSNKRYAYKNKTAEDWEKVINFNFRSIKFEEKLFSKIDAIPEDCNDLNNIELLDLLKKYEIDLDQGV